MTIAVQISLFDTGNTTSGNFNYQCFTQLAKDHPKDHFIFIFDSAYDPSIILFPNITPVLLGPQMKNSLLQHYWYNFKLPRVLNKYNVSVFVSSNHTCSLRTDAEQWIVVHNSSILNRTHRRSTKKNILQFIEKADAIITGNDYLKNKLAAVYPGHEEKTFVIPPGIEEQYDPPEFEEREKLKNNISKGKEFFAYYTSNAGIEQTVTVLKAFSIFKKWQLSEMQLLIIDAAGQEEKLKQRLSAYKFRDHVKITGHKDVVSILSSAYAVIFMPDTENAQNEMLLCLTSGTPVIVPSGEYYKSIFSNAASYADADEKTIAEKMMLLYKNENWRNELIHSGLALAKKLQWPHIARQLWQAIIPVAEP